VHVDPRGTCFYSSRNALGSNSFCRNLDETLALDRVFEAAANFRNHWENFAMNATKEKGQNPTDRHVGARVRMRRNMLGMSQTELGKAVGVTFQQVQKYEKGVNRVSASRMQQFAKILGVSIAFFFEGAPTPKLVGVKASGNGREIPDDIQNFLAMRDGINLVKAFCQITDRKIRRALVDLINQVADDLKRRARRA
jgi:transcriptional regulator with XRE-family HTH domain